MRNKNKFRIINVFPVVTVLLILIPSLQLYAIDFSQLDSVILSGIFNRAYPGAQILIGDTRGVMYEKSYGSFTYGDESPAVDENSIFDIASLTKVVATTTAIMQLYEKGKLNLFDNIIKYIPEFNNNGKDKITIENLLLHNSGLKAWIPFYKYYKTKDEVLNAIYNAELEYPTGSKFLYSDLNAVLLGIIVEKISGTSLDEYCRTNMFEPLNMRNTFFNPPEKVKNRILPTEYDRYWRNKQLQGEVHDETAYILGGVSGNAGLFSNADDIYKIAGLLMNKGKYFNPYTRGLKEEKMFEDKTVMLFTKKLDNLSYRNSRALGWDTKPEPTSFRAPCGELISDNCFGHTGYTGTSIWCDRDRDLIIIFLTNRVYPDRGSNGIKETRPDVHNIAIKIIDRLK